MKIKRSNEEAEVVPNRSYLYDSAFEYIGEIYDKTVTQTDDVHLLRSLIGARKLKILEVFCGHGRILLPLAADGHQVVGLDYSEQMLDTLRIRIGAFPNSVRRRISYHRADAVKGDYPRGFDLVVMGANCLYELSTPEDQAACIEAASHSLVPGGHIFLNNNHMEGCLDESWRNVGHVDTDAFPKGVCSDGTEVNSTHELLWFDSEKRLVRARRTTEVRTPDGNVRRTEFVVQTHPPSTSEMRDWLDKSGFIIEHLWGDEKRWLYTNESRRAVFWARIGGKQGPA